MLERDTINLQMVKQSSSCLLDYVTHDNSKVPREMVWNYVAFAYVI